MVSTPDDGGQEPVSPARDLGVDSFPDAPRADCTAHLPHEFDTLRRIGGNVLLHDRHGTGCRTR